MELENDLVGWMHWCLEQACTRAARSPIEWLRKVARICVNFPIRCCGQSTSIYYNFIGSKLFAETEKNVINVNNE